MVQQRGCCAFSSEVEAESLGFGVSGWRPDFTGTVPSRVGRHYQMDEISLAHVKYRENPAELLGFPQAFIARANVTRTLRLK